MLPKFWEKLNKRELALRGVVIAGLLGMGCILLSGHTPQKQESVQAGICAEDYRRTLEEQLTSLLSGMEGVGRAQVLVTLAGGEAYHYADTGTRLSASREALLENVSCPGVTGVVVVCEGGGTPVIQERVTRAVKTACGISGSRVYVAKLA